MKLTYTIEVDIERGAGPNAKKDRVSAALISDFFRILDGHTVEIKTKDPGQPSEHTIRDIIVWPHEDSVPYHMAMQPREVVNRLPHSKPIDESVES